MLPEICSIGPFTLYSYGLMIAIGVVAAICLGEYEIKKAGLAGEGFMMELGVVTVFGGFLAAKILFWITILPDIIKDPAIMLDFSNGFVVYGGLIGGIAIAYFYCRFKNVDFGRTFDLAVSLIALAQCIGRIGCFLAGCCYGRPTESAFGVVFHASHYAPAGETLFPIQLVSSGLNLLNFLFLYFLYKKAKLKKGMVGSLYIITYSAGRFVLEFFRGDLERGSVGALSTSQFISIFTLAIGVIALIWVKRTSSEEQ